jgi:Fe-S-cluster-containing hydrogenase component 2
VFGLTEVLLNRPRSATAVAFGHPNAAGRVEVAWLPADDFWLLLQKVPRLREPLKRETARQRAHAEQRLATPVWNDPAVQFSHEASQLGLVQGQHLMLIDLDRCTRCDECVRACACSHEDGHSRLFLEGPRFGRHLVPTSCRACLDPVCLIGCPVGSIHRGPGQEIAIEDWCIGCGLCGELCPYGAIQMHDLGIIPEAGSRWRVVPADDLVGNAWQQSAYRDAGWAEGVAPFAPDRAFRDLLAERGLRRSSRSFAFRHGFTLTGATPHAPQDLRLEVVSAGEVCVWVNGRECLQAEKTRGGRHVYVVEAHAFGLRPGPNTVAARVTLAPDSHTGKEPLFQARLDALPSDESSEETNWGPGGRPVTRRAAVCNLCSDQPGGPACVTACPHDAAVRVDARRGLPR